jgi:hypothetical protein
VGKKPAVTPLGTVVPKGVTFSLRTFLGAPRREFYGSVSATPSSTAISHLVQHIAAQPNTAAAAEGFQKMAPSDWPSHVSGSDSHVSGGVSGSDDMTLVPGSGPSGFDEKYSTRFVAIDMNSQEESTSEEERAQVVGEALRRLAANGAFSRDDYQLIATGNGLFGDAEVKTFRAGNLNCRPLVTLCSLVKPGAGDAGSGDEDTCDGKDQTRGTGALVKPGAGDAGSGDEDKCIYQPYIRRRAKSRTLRWSNCSLLHATGRADIMGVTKDSIAHTGAALSAASSSRPGRHRREKRRPSRQPRRPLSPTVDAG